MTLPAFWALVASGGSLPALPLALIFCAGGVVMRSAGCIINDSFDRDLDRKVARTKSRPLASGALSLGTALTILTALLLIALALLWQLHPAARYTALLGFPLIVIYPLTKRFFAFPQLAMGLAFALGVPIAYAHKLGGWSIDALWMYLLAAIWMTTFDLQYALQDARDDRAVGIQSGVLLLGQHSTAIISALHLVLICGWALWGWAHDYQLGFYLLLIPAAACFVYQRRLLLRQHYYQAFSNNLYFALALLAALLLGVGS